MGFTVYGLGPKSYIEATHMKSSQRTCNMSTPRMERWTKLIESFNTFVRMKNRVEIDDKRYLVSVEQVFEEGLLHACHLTAIYSGSISCLEKRSGPLWQMTTSFQHQKSCTCLRVIAKRENVLPGAKKG